MPINKKSCIGCLIIVGYSDSDPTYAVYLGENKVFDFTEKSIVELDDPRKQILQLVSPIKVSSIPKQFKGCRI